MSRLHKRLIVIFCLGVLLCGIGAGVAFTEFSTLTYGGQQILGDPDIKTTDIDVEFEAGEEKRKIWGTGISDVFFQTDNRVPKDTVRFSVTYNADCVEPFAYWSKEDEIVLSWYWKNRKDETALMMEAKDVVLQNLKEGKIVSFDTPDMEKVVVKINPENEEDVKIVH